MIYDPGLPAIIDSMDKYFDGGLLSNEKIEYAQDTEIADITSNPTDDVIYDAFLNASDKQQIEFANAYRGGLPLNNIIRKMIKRNAIFDVKGSYDE